MIWGYVYQPTIHNRDIKPIPFFGFPWQRGTLDDQLSLFLAYQQHPLIFFKPVDNRFFHFISP